MPGIRNGWAGGRPTVGRRSAGGDAAGWPAKLRRRNRRITAGDLAAGKTDFEIEVGRAFSVKETAQILGVSEKTVGRLVKRKLLRASRALRHHLIPTKEIEKFLDETSSQ